MALLEMNQQSAIGYLRLAASEPNSSKPEQEAMIRSFCFKRGWNVVEIFSDDVGSDSLTTLPGFRAMLTSLQRYPNRRVIVASLSQLAIRTDQLDEFLDLLGPVARICFALEQLDGSSECGSRCLQLIADMAIFQRNEAEARKAVGRAQRKKAGKRAGRIPFGFKRGVHGQMEVDPEEMKTIQSIKRRRQRSGTPYATLAKETGLSVGTVFKLCNTDLRTLKRTVFQPLLDSEGDIPYGDPS